MACNRQVQIASQGTYMASLLSGAVTMPSISPADASFVASITHCVAHLPASLPTSPNFICDMSYANGEKTLIALVSISALLQAAMLSKERTVSEPPTNAMPRSIHSGDPMTTKRASRCVSGFASTLELGYSTVGGGQVET